MADQRPPMSPKSTDFEPLVTPTKEGGSSSDESVQRGRRHKRTRCLVFSALFCLSAGVAYLNYRPREQRHQDATSDEAQLNHAAIPPPRMEKIEFSGIHFIGERHTGTKWMHAHLKDCFDSEIPVMSNFTRWKHWFQWDTDRYGKLRKNGLVIAQFRNVYDWVEAMRELPYHAPAHRHLNWRNFVTKPWGTERWGLDLTMTNTSGRCCIDAYHYDEIVPCSRDLYHYTKSRPHYELQLDQSGQPYNSIIELRADKIRNFLSIPTFQTVGGFLMVRYEDVVRNGTASFLRQIEEMTGVKAKCKPEKPRKVHHKDVSPAYIRWMNAHVDWEAEKLVGYDKISP